MEVQKMSNFMGFSSDQMNVFLMLIDQSSSMRDDEENVRFGLKIYQKKFENFPGVNSIAVSICKFSDQLVVSEFKQVKDLNLSYSTNGCTALNYSIVHAAKYLNNYIQEITKVKGTPPRATFIVFSDGEPCQDRMSESDGMKAIQRLNLANVDTAFVAFGEGITSEFGKRMGFMSTINVTDRNKLVNFLGVELSNACKEQSQSMKSLGADFFSHAADKTKSEGYSQTTAQALEDTSWIDEI